MRTIRFVEKAKLLIKYIDYQQFTVMEHHFAVGNIYLAHVMADEAINAIWGKVVEENIRRGY